ncbi:MAG: adenine deaminase [Candidatus Limnocylindrales bacterium]
MTAELARRIAVARGDEPADLVLKGGRIFSVFTGEFLEGDLAVAGEYVAGIGRYEGRQEVDVAGLILLPGFIDAHMHLESTKLMVDEFARAVLPWGTTTVVLDPHEIANVFGLAGVRALLASADRVPLDYYVMAPSCVPASPFESSAFMITAADIAQFLADEPRALGLAELMDFPGTVRGDPAVLDKIEVTQAAGGHVDGHAPRLSGPELNAYLAAGVGSDHECTTLEEALEKRRLGMQIMIREGSATRDVAALIPLVIEHGPANCMLCTDDREPHHLLERGHVNDAIRKSVSLGCRPADAVIMATLNAARWHRLWQHGALAPGYLADIVAVPDLEHFRPARVWKRGRLVAQDGVARPLPKAAVPDWMRGSVHIPTMTADHFRVEARGSVRVLGVEPGNAVTRSLVFGPPWVGGTAAADPDRDLAKVAVVERHRGTGRVGLGFVTGFGLRRGALASTHAHDAHNLIVVGMNDADMAAAANRLAEIGGGQVAVANGRVLAEVPLPIGGLLADLPFEQVAAAVRALEEAARVELGAALPAPVMALSFLALSVIPELKISDRGLVDTVAFQAVPLEVEPIEAEPIRVEPASSAG